MTSIRKCERNSCACSTVRELSPSKPCDCGECVAYMSELLDQYEGERGTWQGIIDSQSTTIDRLQGLLSRARPYVGTAEKNGAEKATSLLEEIDNE